MFVEGGKPKVGAQSKNLGVRTPPNPHADIAVDAAGNVQPGAGGMSVAPDWRLLPGHLIPKRLKHVVPKARGSNQLCCWRLDDGAFQPGKITADLWMSPDPAAPNRHGFVEPSRRMALHEFQAALFDTRDDWVRDES
jgi:hypothetical protein